MFRYLVTTLTFRIPFIKIFNSKLKSGNAYYYLMQKLVFELLLKNINIKAYRRLILSAVSYACEAWSHTLREEDRLMVFEKRTLGRHLGQKGMR